MNRFSHCLHRLLTIALLCGAASAPALADETASYALDIEAKLHSDIRNRGISDTLLKPGARLSVQLAHESGVIALFELATSSKKQFLGGHGYSALIAGGYRFGDPDAWHFGFGVASELFPGASFDAPHGFDLSSFEPTDWRRTKYDSQFAVLEAGYGALDARILNVLSRTYRGADTGGVCAALGQFNPDPTAALECFARGDRNSRGSWLVDLNYKHSLAPHTTLNLHAGYQHVRNFKEATLSDYAVGVTHRHWGMDFTAEWLATRAHARDLYLVQDGDRLRATDNKKLVLTVARKF